MQLLDQLILRTTRADLEFKKKENQTTIKLLPI